MGRRDKQDCGCDDNRESECCCRGPRGRRGPQGPAAVNVQDVAPRYGASYALDNFNIVITANTGQLQNFSSIAEQSFQLNNAAIFTPTRPMLININAMFDVVFDGPAPRLDFSALGRRQSLPLHDLSPRVGHYSSSCAQWGSACCAWAGEFAATSAFQFWITTD